MMEFVIESTPDAMLRIMDDNPTVGRICRNGWAQLALLDPHSAQILRFSGGRFVPFTPGHAELPIAETSLDWYRGHRDEYPWGIDMIEGPQIVIPFPGPCSRKCQSGSFTCAVTLIGFDQLTPSSSL